MLFLVEILVIITINKFKHWWRMNASFRHFGESFPSTVPLLFDSTIAADPISYKIYLSILHQP